jgi:hypothetical protein
MLLKSLLAIVQLLVFGALLPVYGLVLLVFGALNLVYKTITGMSFDNIDLAMEPLWWAMHQLMVVFGIKDDFRAAPYLS